MLRFVVALLSLCLLSACGGEQGGASDPANFPQRPLKVIIPFGAGGLADVTTRLAADGMGRQLGQPLVIENRPGAGGVAATSTMLNANADGHTLIVLTNGTTISESQFPELPYSISDDLQPVSALVWFDLVVLAGVESGIDSFATLLARVADGAELRIATINPGSTQHLSAELFKRRAGIDATIITYRTTPDVLGALLRNEVDLAIDSFTALKGAIEGGQAIPLAVTGSERNAALPTIPTVQEAGVEDFVVEGWNALYTHAEVAPLVIERLQQAMAVLAADPALQARYAELGVLARPNAPAAMRERFAEDVIRWRAVMQDVGLIP